MNTLRLCTSSGPSKVEVRSCYSRRLPVRVSRHQHSYATREVAAHSSNDLSSLELLQTSYSDHSNGAFREGSDVFSVVIRVCQLLDLRERREGCTLRAEPSVSASRLLLPSESFQSLAVR